MLCWNICSSRLPVLAKICGFLAQTEPLKCCEVWDFFHKNYCFYFVQVSQIHFKVDHDSLRPHETGSSQTPACRAQAEGHWTGADIRLMLTSEKNPTNQNLIFVTYCLTRPHVNHVNKSRAY